MADFLRCKDCKHDNGKCVGVSRRASHKNCFEPKVMTNADRIRAMSDEELADFLSQYKFCDICDEGCDSCTYNGDCDKRLLQWLKQPAEG
jgi:hypothetical protein